MVEKSSLITRHSDLARGGGGGQTLHTFGTFPRFAVVSVVLVHYHLSPTIVPAYTFTFFNLYEIVESDLYKTYPPISDQ